MPSGQYCMVQAALLPTAAHMLHLQAFIQQHGESESEVFAPARALAMPARSELRAVGKHSLVRAIEHAGGFLAVAQVTQPPPSHLM